MFPASALACCISTCDQVNCRVSPLVSPLIDVCPRNQFIFQWGSGSRLGTSCSHPLQLPSLVCCPSVYVIFLHPVASFHSFVSPVPLWFSSGLHLCLYLTEGGLLSCPKKPSYPITSCVLSLLVA